MSRIGKKPVQIPAGVTVEIEGTTVTVKGPKGELTRSFSELIKFEQEGEEVNVIRVDESTESNAQQGLSRTLHHNVGYRVALKGKDLDLSLGYSHPVIYKAPENIEFLVPDNTHITVKGISKEQVGQVAAEIRMKRPPEPYKGKGIHYEGEHIRRKLGKAAK